MPLIVTEVLKNVPPVYGGTASVSTYRCPCYIPWATVSARLLLAVAALPQAHRACQVMSS